MVLSITFWVVFVSCGGIGKGRAQAVWPEKNRQMSLKVAQIWFHSKNDRLPLQKLPKNVGDLGKLIFAKGFKKLPKVQ